MAEYVSIAKRKVTYCEFRGRSCRLCASKCVLCLFMKYVKWICLSILTFPSRSFLLYLSSFYVRTIGWKMFSIRKICDWDKNCHKVSLPY